MHELLNYPFDSNILMSKRRRIKRELLEQNIQWKDLKIAILGGSTTHDVKEILELFLLNQGIRPSFYESEYNQFYEDAVFGNDELNEFKPELVYIFTTYRNISEFPSMNAPKEEIDRIFSAQMSRFERVWESLTGRFQCTVIQNNFEYPEYRILGNQDASDIHGRVNFIGRLNLGLSDYYSNHPNFYINDINYQAAQFGLDNWHDGTAWYMYKYAMNLEAVPTIAFNVSNIIKAIFGKNKKALALDLDNTLWGGIVGDDGPENLEIGEETARGQAYSAFQRYLKCLRDIGILLNVVSKNEKENAMAGIAHPSMLLKEDDFIEIKADWEPKSGNLVKIAKDINLLPESFVFVDDNPAEREIVRQQVPGVGIPALSAVENYIREVDHAGFFETTHISSDDLRRNEMYRENAERSQLLNDCADYGEYLKSLGMKAKIGSFESVYMARIAQLTNKSNQFNLTTLRLTQEEIETMAADSGYITLYGQLEDVFGDNGVVALSIGKIDGKTCKIILWLMSCRVLKRDMECAMLDSLVEECLKRGVEDIEGTYIPTAKNGMVREFYGTMGFEKMDEQADGTTHWLLKANQYQTQNKYIELK